MTQTKKATPTAELREQLCRARDSLTGTGHTHTPSNVSYNVESVWSLESTTFRRTALGGSRNGAYMYGGQFQVLERRARGPNGAQTHLESIDYRVSRAFLQTNTVRTCLEHLECRL
jgi:hypothetical protein